tara:strand:- start:130 stop:318 length:189 start_codon:yes stop_codon:yes gene_type:complete
MSQKQIVAKIKKYINYGREEMNLQTHGLYISSALKENKYCKAAVMAFENPKLHMSKIIREVK